MNAQPDTALDPVGTTWDSAERHINYTLTGPSQGEVVLLVAGLGMQRIEWTAEFVEAIHDAGYRTLMADNRDCGATQVDSETSYTLEDMAQDLIALLDGLQIAHVHVVGMSMGGMLAQHIAISAPERCLSLTSLMSTTGRRGVGRPHEQSKWIFTSSAPTDSLAAYTEYAQRQHRSIAGARYVDDVHAAATAARVFARGVRPDGTARQLAAIQVDGDRTERLAMVTAPTLVVHGDADPMIDVSGGEATSAAIAGSTFVTIADMGHSVPVALASELSSLMAAHFDASAKNRP